MRRAWLLVFLSCLAAGSAFSDSSNLEGGVFIAHAPPGLQYSDGEDWCARYFQDFAIDSCSEQHNRIDVQGAISVWFVLAAWDEAKEWCGTEFGFAAYDSTIYLFDHWGPCPAGALGIPTAGWPGPNKGIALSLSGTSWSGNFVPVYFFAGYAYYQGTIPLAANPASGFGGAANCETPPEAFGASAFGSMGIFEDGTAVCPGGLEGGGLEGGTLPDGSEDEAEGGFGGADQGPSSRCGEGEIIVRFAPGVISFPQDDPDGPRGFTASLEDAELSLSALQMALEDIGAVSFATVAPLWRHLTPERCLDIHGNRVKLVDFTDVYRVDLSGAVSVEEAISTLGGEPGVIHVECDPLAALYTLPPGFPDDPYYPEQWHLENAGDGDCLEGLDMNAYAAWDSCCAFSPPISAGTKIGMSDSPVNSGHEDLAPFICRSLCRSFPIPETETLPWELHHAPGQHCTATSSLAAAGTHNDTTGIASLPNLPPSSADSVLVILRLDAPTLQEPEILALSGSAALAYVCTTGVYGRIGVVNQSWGYDEWRGCYNYNHTLRDACRNAFRKGIALVCAAGNDKTPTPPGGCTTPDTAVAFPAAFPDYCIAVAGIDCAGDVNGSFKAASYIDLAGPGYGLWVADSADVYRHDFIWGTSYASPVVAGAVALLIGADSSLTNEDCSALLKLTANPINGLEPWQIGAGLPDLRRALTWVVPPCGIVHDSLRTTSYTADSVGQWTVSFMNVEGVNETPEEWQDFEVVPYRVTVQVQLPIGTHVLQVWPRGSRSAGWRLIDEHLDGNPNPHYDARFYDNWARVLSWAGGPDCTFECYTYKVMGETVQWVPFAVGDEYWLNYSYVACDELPLAVGDAPVSGGTPLSVLGSTVCGSGSVSFRVTLQDRRRLRVSVFGPDGRVVRNLLRGEPFAAGLTKLDWDLRDEESRQVPSGIYFVRMWTESDRDEKSAFGRRLVVVR